MQQGICILGATGTIGINTLDVIARHPQRFRVVALTAHSQVDRMLELCIEWQPRFAVMGDAIAAGQLEQLLQKHGLEIEVAHGADALAAAASHVQVDAVMAGIVGAAGLIPTLAAVQAGKRVMIANKEPLVMMGSVFIEEARRSGAILLPIDSEHNAIFQCLPPALQQGAPSASGNAFDAHGISRILLTGSGGPFRSMDATDFAGVTPEQACAHPNWVMGRKISVDSATMMNKGLELIEACALFGTTPEHIEIVVHPESVIHSMVEYRDGSILAQLGNPDMRTPIAHALGWPERIDAGVNRLDLPALASFQFMAPDTIKFPALRLAERAAWRGGTLPTILNAANEIAVQAFLDGEIRFDHIIRLVELVMDGSTSDDVQDLDSVLAADRQSRAMARSIIDSSSLI
jgi:1-deoxy-D-xylulose-5-phosphate reductoisomerase